MAVSTESPASMSRGLLTKAEREFLRGEKDDVDHQQYLYNVRSNFRSRVEKVEDDLDVLRDAGEDDLVEEFYGRFGRVERLERELESLRRELEAERNE